MIQPSAAYHIYAHRDPSTSVRRDDAGLSRHGSAAPLGRGLIAWPISVVLSPVRDGSNVRVGDGADVARPNEIVV